MAIVRVYYPQRGALTIPEDVPAYDTHGRVKPTRQRRGCFFLHLAPDAVDMFPDDHKLQLFSFGFISLAQSADKLIDVGFTIDAAFVQDLAIQLYSCRMQIANSSLGFHFGTDA